MKTAINFPENTIINRVHASKVALLITIIVVSVMMVLTTTTAEFANDSIIPPIITLSVIACIVASVIIAMSLKRGVYAATHSPIKCVVVDFAESGGADIAAAAQGNRWSNIPKLAKKSTGNAMKMEVVYSADLSFVAYQFFSYVPHSFEPCSEIFYVDRGDVARINFAELKL